MEEIQHPENEAFRKNQHVAHFPRLQFYTLDETLYGDIVQLNRDDETCPHD